MKTRLRVTTVEEITVESGGAASFIIDLVNTQQTTYSEGGYSLEEAGSTYSVRYTAEVVDDRE
jgi:hypothetical protein